MRKFFTKTIAFLVVILQVFSFVACGSENEPAVSNEFKIRGEQEIVVYEGYEQESSLSYKFDGVGQLDMLSVALENNLNGKLSWDDENKIIKISKGLEYGDYTTSLVATLINQEEKTAKLQITVKVKLPVIPEGEPKITGKGYDAVNQNYSAFSTKRFSLYGTDVSVAISTVKKDGVVFTTDAFTWNNEERKLNVASGLSDGVYTVTLLATGLEKYQPFEFVYSLTVQGDVTPVINGPTELSIGEGYLSGALSNFMVAGAISTPSVTLTNESDSVLYGMVSYDLLKDEIKFESGLAAGNYTATISVNNGNSTGTVSHNIAVIVEKGKSVAGAFSYTSGKYVEGKYIAEEDAVTGKIKSLDNNFYYPVQVDGTDLSGNLIDGKYELILESKYFCETKSNFTVTNGIKNDIFAVFTVPSIVGEMNYIDDGFSIVRDNKLYYALNGATTSENFVVSYTMQSLGDSSDPWINGGFCFKVEDKWYSMLVYPDVRASGEAEIRVWFSQGDAGRFVNGGYAHTNIYVSEKYATINVKIAFYNGTFYVSVGELGKTSSSVMITKERFEENSCAKDCNSLWFDENNFNICKNGKTTASQEYAKIDTSVFFGKVERTLGFRCIDISNKFTNVSYAFGNDIVKSCVSEMSAYKKDCLHYAWDEVK